MLVTFCCVCLHAGDVLGTGQAPEHLSAKYDTPCMEDKYTNPQRTRHRDHHTTDTKDREHTRKYTPLFTTQSQLVTLVTYQHTIARISTYSLIFSSPQNTLAHQQ